MNDLSNPPIPEHLRAFAEATDAALATIRETSFGLIGEKKSPASVGMASGLHAAELAAFIAINEHGGDIEKLRHMMAVLAGDMMKHAESSLEYMKAAETAKVAVTEVAVTQ